MTSMTPLQALREILGPISNGRAVDKLQVPLFTSFGLKMSYRAIEAVLLNNPGIFSQQEGRWIVRPESRTDTRIQKEEDS